MFRMTLQHNAGQVAEALAQAPEAVGRQIDRALMRGAIEVSRAARENAPKARSELVNSIGPERISPLEHHVVAASRQAVMVEQGTGPGGRPTLGEMLDWIRIKSITPRLPGLKPAGLAALLRHRVAERGIAAHPFMEPALEQKWPGIVEAVEAAAVAGLGAP